VRAPGEPLPNAAPPWGTLHARGTREATCAGLRQAILKRAFEGRLVPQDPNDEPAGALLERMRGERETLRKRPPTAGWRAEIEGSIDATSYPC